MIKVSLFTDLFIGAEFAYERLIFTLLLVWATLAGKMPLWLAGVWICVYSVLYLLSTCIVAATDPQ
jgi:hypothetical protein